MLYIGANSMYGIEPPCVVKAPLRVRLSTAGHWRSACGRGRMVVDLLSLVGCVLFLSSSAQSETGVESFRDLRYDKVIGQTSTYTCGAAAIATLLTFFFDAPSSEHEIMSLVEESVRDRGKESDGSQGATAYDLKRSLARKGLDAAGYRVTLSALEDFFLRGGLPVVVHVTRPTMHFLVVVGVLEGQVLVADPSWGRSIIPVVELETCKGMSGIVLVPLPGPDVADHARVKQAAALDWMRSRLARLSSLREAMQ